MSEGFLHRYFLNNAGNRLHKWIHYFDVYERHFERFRGQRPVMLEIGVAGGGSVAMWKDYFGAGCQIIGLDINPDCKAYETDEIEIFIGSQDDPVTIAGILDKYPTVDIVLDDGGHVMPQMVKSFELLYDSVSDNGVYFVEDTHTCYLPEYGGGVETAGTFMEFTKRKMDELNAYFSRSAIPVSKFTRSTHYIAIYDSIIVFEKKPQGHRIDPVTMRMP